MSISGRREGALLSALFVLTLTVSAGAQVTPPPAGTVPDDTPRLRVGTTIFADYTIQFSPDQRDAAGNEVDFSAFQVPRAYINLTGQVHHLLAFRVTPDLKREAGNGSLIFRLKYGYAQLNLEDWMTPNSWVRFGIQQTPLIDYQERIYRYRFEGPVFADREDYLSSSDAGVSFQTTFPNDYGELHAGIYNGETYSSGEVNDRKAYVFRGTVRPLPEAAILRGLRFTGFYHADAPVKGGERRRAIGDIGFEHPRVHAGFTWLDATDQALPAQPEVDSRGFSAWVTPRTSIGWEGLLRFDHLEPNVLTDERKDRVIAGVAYWLPISGAQAAFLLKLEDVRYRNYAAPPPDERLLVLHMLINF